MSNIQQSFRDITRYGEQNLFDLSDFKQEDNEINLNDFLDTAKNKNKRKIREPVIEVLINSRRDVFPFLLNRELNFNDEEQQIVIRFTKNSDEKAKSIEEMIDKYDETMEVLFSGFMINYRMLFNEINRSSYVKGSDAFNNALEYKL